MLKFNWFNKKKEEAYTAKLPGGGQSRANLELSSPTWLFLETRLRDEISSLHEQLEVPGNTRERDLLIKGEIRGLNKILDLSKNDGRDSAQQILTRQYFAEETYGN